MTFFAICKLVHQLEKERKKKKNDSRNILEVFSFQFEQNQIM